MVLVQAVARGQRPGLLATAGGAILDETFTLGVGWQWQCTGVTMWWVGHCRWAGAHAMDGHSREREDAG